MWCALFMLWWSLCSIHAVLITHVCIQHSKHVVSQVSLCSLTPPPTPSHPTPPPPPLHTLTVSMQSAVKKRRLQSLTGDTGAGLSEGVAGMSVIVATDLQDGEEGMALSSGRGREQGCEEGVALPSGRGQGQTAVRTGTCTWLRLLVYRALR